MRTCTPALVIFSSLLLAGCGAERHAAPAPVAAPGTPSAAEHPSHAPAAAPAAAHGTHAAAAHGSVSGEVLSTDDIFTLLMAGNVRWRGGLAEHPHQNATGRAMVANGQAPRVAVLTCADSRVPPEVIFDAGLGELFVLRVAGNVVTPENLASLEYAVEHLGTRAILVLGHERCGAVKAALAGGEAPGHLPALLDRIKPAVAEATAMGGDREANAIAANARIAADLIRDAKPVLKDAIATGRVAVRAAVYDLDTGAVTVVTKK